MVKKRVSKKNREINSQSKLLLLVIVTAFIIYLAYLVLAVVAVHGGIVVSIPGSGTNVSSLNNTFIINVTYNVTGITNPIVANGSFDGVSPTNATSSNMTIFYINDSGTWRAINGTINSSAYIIESNSSISVVVNTTLLTDVNYSAAINVTIGNLTSAVYINPANMSYNITVDDTPPAVTEIAALAGINYSNASSTTSNGFVVINVTITDAVIGPATRAIVQVRNASGQLESTVLLNLTRETAGRFSNSTGLNVSLFTEGMYNITIWANDTLNNNNYTLTSGNIWFDSSKPVAFASNISVSNTSTPLAGNYSQNLTLNVSVTDSRNAGFNVSNVSSVLFLVKNGTGGTNATYSASREASTNRWNYVINTTNFPDGNYTVAVFVNDSARNTNTSAETPNYFFIDNSGPSVSYSCTPSSVTEGESITCTCSGSDSTSGFNTSTISYTETPATGQTGTFSLSCSGADNAGNGGSVTISYSVTGIGSSSGGGGGGGGAATSTGEASKAQSWTKISPSETTTMKNFAAEYGVKEINIQVSNEAQNVKVTVTKYDSKPAEISTSKEGKVYKYLKIATENLEGKINKATITIKVPQSWVSENKLDKDNVALFKLVGSNWNELTTKYKEADAISYIYDVDVTGFSYFAIGQKTIAKEEKEAQPSPAAAAEEAVKKAAEEAKSWLSANWWLGILIVVIIAGIVAFIIYKKRH